MLIGLLVGSGKNDGPNHGHFDYGSFAHWHVPAIIEEWWLVNGSLSGASEFDPSCGRHSGPAQMGLLIGRHGIVGWVPFAGGRNSKKGLTPSLHGVIITPDMPVSPALSTTA